ncbi:MAG: hypothetical protein HC875_20495 [Anaerolineales bacterium]|nr:hypothetical protein [Anaerolineales bacterium]
MKKAISQTFKRLKPPKALVDRVIDKTISRKFLAWITATVFVVMGKDIPEAWLILTSLYIGAESLLDALMMRITGGVKTVAEQAQNIIQPIHEPEPDIDILVDDPDFVVKKIN